MALLITAPPTTATRSRRHRTGSWVIASAFLVVMAFSTVPTPLYALYQARDGFATIVVTVVFAAYAVGVVASLYLAGHLSDWMGRRRVLLASVLVELLAAAVFLVWPDVSGLLVARLLCGLGVGALTATATAHIGELRAVAAPHEDGRTATVVAGFANLGGLGLGTLVSGVLAQWVTAPLVVPYVVFAVLLAVAATAIAFVPETVERPQVRPAYRPQRVALPPTDRGTFLSAGAAAFLGFAIFGLFTSLAPTFLIGTLHEPSRLVAGAVTFAAFGSAAAAQVLTMRLPARLQLRLSTLLIGAGLIAMAVAPIAASLPLFIVAGVLTGGGVGIQFRSAIAAAAALAAPAQRGEVLAALFLIAYAGLTVPVLLLGVALTVLPSTAVLIGFAAIVLAASIPANNAMSRRMSAGA
ncbi:MFS transporter [Pseudonocardia sp. GCM10023141]|uniref:MFS transporter n=1 Tax=Pseudonocardia sp. GCM10023141 TaxID=3252653 RepID=UPI003617F221